MDTAWWPNIPKPFCISAHNVSGHKIVFLIFSCLSSFIGTRRLSAEDHLSLQFFAHLSWPGLVFLNVFLWETFSVIQLSMKDDQWIINFSHLDPFNSSSVEGEHVLLLLQFAPAIGCSVYHSKDCPHHTHRPSLGTDIYVSSSFSLHCDCHAFPLFLSFLCIALNPFRLWMLAVFSISSSVASFFLPPAMPGSISAYFFSSFSIQENKTAFW